VLLDAGTRLSIRVKPQPPFRAKKPGDVTARVKDAETAQKKSVLLFVAKGGKQSEMRFIAVRIKKE
jgi:hypothetical protein